MKAFRVIPVLTVLFWTILGVNTLWVNNSHAKATVEELVVGPAQVGGWYVFSPGGGHVAYAGTRGSRVGVTVDAVEGPTLDELYNPFGASFMSPANIAAMTASSGGRTNQAAQGAPVIMSADGQHYAYAGRQGEEYVVIHDGREIARGPREALSLNYNPLTLSPGGKHVYWNENNGKGSARWLQRLVMDGKPGPWSGHQDILPVFSPDDTRYAYTYVSPDDANQHELIVDGKPAGYNGLKLRFTADSKHLVSVGRAAQGGGEVLLMDGKPAIKARSIQKLVLAPTGSRYAAIAFKDVPGSTGAYMLFIDGKEIAGTENVMEVWFSQDGKRYAAAVENKAARAMFMVIDGKQQREYQSVSTNVAPTWFANNTRLLYLVSGGGRSFVVVDEQEFEIAYLGALQATANADYFSWHTYDGSNRKHSLIINGQEALLPGLYPRGYELSPNGERHAYQASQIGRSDVAGMVVDGKLLEDFFPHTFGNLQVDSNVQGARGFLFSPDSQHIALLGGRAEPKSVGLYIDGNLVYPTGRGLMNLAFTPDSKHLTWLSSEVFPDRPQPYHLFYMDGEAVLKLGNIDLLRVGGSWHVDQSGVLTVMAADGDKVKRFRITPDPGMTIARLVSEAGAKQARAQAEQLAAQQQAAEAAAAAKAKAEAERAEAAAKRQADYDAAVAKRKADYDAAVAAKKAAYAAAVEAKQQARLLQLENAKRAKQGLPPLKELPPQ